MLVFCILDKIFKLLKISGKIYLLTLEVPLLSISPCNYFWL